MRKVRFYLNSLLIFLLMLGSIWFIGDNNYETLSFKIGLIFALFLITFLYKKLIKNKIDSNFGKKEVLKDTNFGSKKIEQPAREWSTNKLFYKTGLMSFVISVISGLLINTLALFYQYSEQEQLMGIAIEIFLLITLIPLALILKDRRIEADGTWVIPKTYRYIFTILSPLGYISLFALGGAIIIGIGVLLAIGGGAF